LGLYCGLDSKEDGYTAEAPLDRTVPYLIVPILPRLELPVREAEETVLLMVEYVE
jgi:hypothetical protein